MLFSSIPAPTQSLGSRDWFLTSIRWTTRQIQQLFPQSSNPVESLLESAKRRTGFSQWGNFTFHDGLSATLDSVKRDCEFGFIGHMLIRRLLLQYLMNRLCAEALCQSQPEIEQREMLPPVVVLGWPRTGTTLLHRLLALDPAARPLMGWEAAFPVVMYRHGKSLPDRRQADCNRGLLRYARLRPQWAMTHEFTPDGPEECSLMLGNSFLRPALLDFGQPTYRRWLAQVSDDYLVDVYRFHRRLLQSLQGPAMRQRWTLKSPTHFYALHGLLKVFPQAVIIQTHRNPQSVVGSSASLMSRLLPKSLVRRDVIGPEVLTSLQLMWERGMAARQQLPAGRIIDVRYDDLVARPQEVMRSIYRQANLAWPNDLEERIAGWLTSHPQHQWGRHLYSLEEFGLTPDRVQESIGRAAAQYV